MIRRALLTGIAALLLTVSANAGEGGADKVDVRVIYAHHCATKSVDPKIGQPVPPSMGYECLELKDRKTMDLPMNKASTMSLPDGRLFQLTLKEKAGNRLKMVGAINQADGTLSHSLGNISAEPNVPFNVGGIKFQDGVLLLSMQIK